MAWFSRFTSILSDVEQLAACDDHNSVVKLARSWGFEIARRWGDGEGAALDRPF